MPKEKNENKIRNNAQKVLDRAEAFLDNERYEKAYKEFIKAAEIYQDKLGEYRIAEQCFFYGSKSLVHEEKYLAASIAMRNSGNCCVLLDDYTKAADYYDISAKYALKSNRKDAENRSILSACFAYLCLFLKGQQDKGLAFIKKIKHSVDSKEFAENSLVRLVKGLTLAIVNKDDSALRIIEEDYINYKFGDAETKLIKDALIMAKTYLLLKYDLEIPEKEVLNEDFIKFSLNLDFSALSELEHDSYLKYKFKNIKIIDVGMTYGDNLSTASKPTLPITVQDEKINLDFSLRANFMGEGNIGPINFTIEFDERLFFFGKTKTYKILVKSPPTKLGINLKPLVNPIINQTFPMEIKLTNPSEATAVNITIDFEFPESLRLMRGTMQKKIYQLIRNEEFKWQLSLKPLEPGTHIIKATVTFFDQDNNQIGPSTAELPFEINL